jgi:DNA-binding IclR family transcriptional regulator
MDGRDRRNPQPSTSKPLTKSAQVIALLEAEDGATLADLSAVTGWQPHTCRAFFTGLRKKGRVLERSHRADGASVYKLVAAEVAAQ